MPILSPRHQALGNTIRELRQAAGMTQETLGERANMSTNYVGDTERGERNISVRALWQLAAALGVPTPELLAGAEEEPGREKLPGSTGGR
jgi:transcriptional regulator with XRE-family HTH domain